MTSIESKTKTSVNALTINVANAFFEETKMDGKFCFGRRFDSIRIKLKEWKQTYKLNVVCIQEIKQCKDITGKALTVDQITSAFANDLEMNYEVQGNTKDPTWIHRALFYDKVFKLVKTETIWFKRTDRDNEQNNLHAIILEDLRSGELLTFWSCHPPHTKAKVDYYEMLNQSVKNNVTKTKYHIALGDFNTFTDDDHSVLQTLHENFINLTSDVKQTFYSFPYDLDPEGKPWQGKTDHILLNKLAVDNVTITAFSIEDRLLSDHWPLFCSFTLSSCLNN